MRNLIYAINLTIDGCCDHTKSGGSEEILDHYTAFLQEVDQIIYGRKTYELMIPYWPEVAEDPSSTEAEIRYAKAFNAIDKIVFSKTLTSVEGENTRLVHTNLVEEITKLKQEDGKSIIVGGVDLPSQLIAHGLVDEIRLVINPVVVGEGRRLLDTTTLQEKLNLKLVGTKIFNAGNIALHYVRK